METKWDSSVKHLSAKREEHPKKLQDKGTIDIIIIDDEHEEKDENPNGW